MLTVPGLAPAAPAYAPINYEQPNLPNEPILTTATTTSSQVEAPLPGLSAGSIVDTEAGQPPSGSFYLPSLDESDLSQLPSLDSSNGGVDASFDQSIALSAS